MLGEKIARKPCNHKTKTKQQRNIQEKQRLQLTCSAQIPRCTEQTFVPSCESCDLCRAPCGELRAEDKAPCDVSGLLSLQWCCVSNWGQSNASVIKLDM